MGLSNTSRRPLYVFILLLLLIIALVSSLKASGHSTRFLQLSSLSSQHNSINSALCSTTPSSSSLPRNATIVILVNPSSNHFQVLLPTLQNLEEKFNRRLGYPIQLLTDGELPDEGVRKRTEWITGGKAKWCEFTLRDFALLSSKNEAYHLPAPLLVTLPPRSSCDTRAGLGCSIMDHTRNYRCFNRSNGFLERLSVRLLLLQPSIWLRLTKRGVANSNMCRFFSMWHWKHPAVREFKYIWRLDDTSRFHCSLVRIGSLTITWRHHKLIDEMHSNCTDGRSYRNCKFRSARLLQVYQIQPFAPENPSPVFHLDVSWYFPLSHRWNENQLFTVYPILSLSDADSLTPLTLHLSFLSGFSQIFEEQLYVIPSLWNTTLNFIRDNQARKKGWIRAGKEENWLDLISDDGGETYNLRWVVMKL